jgi:hypothetical protein
LTLLWGPWVDDNLHEGSIGNEEFPSFGGRFIGDRLSRFRAAQRSEGGGYEPVDSQYRLWSIEPCN